MRHERESECIQRGGPGLLRSKPTLSMCQMQLATRSRVTEQPGVRIDGDGHTGISQPLQRVAFVGRHDMGLNVACRTDLQRYLAIDHEPK